MQSIIQRGKGLIIKTATNTVTGQYDEFRLFLKQGPTYTA
jgi:hypothetical protein